MSGDKVNVAAVGDPTEIRFMFTPEGSRGSCTVNGTELAGDTYACRVGDPVSVVCSASIPCHSLVEIVNPDGTAHQAESGGIQAFTTFSAPELGEVSTVVVRSTDVVRTVTASVSGGVGGSVSPASASASCSDSALLTATPDECYEFVEWSFDPPVRLSYESAETYPFAYTPEVAVYPEYDTTAVARFMVKQTFVGLNQAYGGTAEITDGLRPESTDIADRCATLHLKATLDDCYEFDYWHLEFVADDGGPNPDPQDIASFAELDWTIPARVSSVFITPFYRRRTVNVTAVSSHPCGHVSGGGPAECGNQVTLTASGDASCCHLSGWTSSEGETRTGSSITVTVPDSDVTWTANFTPVPHSLSLEQEGAAPGVFELHGAGSYLCDQAPCVSFTPETAGTGYVFLGWYSGNVRYSESREYCLSVLADTTLTAKFALDCDPDGSRKAKCEESGGTWDDSDQDDCHCSCADPLEQDPDDRDRCRCSEGAQQACANKPTPHHLTDDCECKCTGDRMDALESHCTATFADITGTWNDDYCRCDCGLDGRAEPDSDGYCRCKETEEKAGCTEEHNKAWDPSDCTCGCLESAVAECDVDDPGSDWEWRRYPDCECVCPHEEGDVCTIRREADGYWHKDDCSCTCKDELKDRCEAGSYDPFHNTWDHENCKCTCSEGLRDRCELEEVHGTHEWDEETCTCSCKDDRSSECEAKGGEHFWDLWSCSCKCANEDPMCGMGDPTHYWDDETCTCKCVDVPQEEIDSCGECTDDNPSCGTWDTQEKPCGCSCPYGKELDGWSCRCVDGAEEENLCNKTKSPDGSGWDPKTCTCDCGTFERPDGRRQDREWSRVNGCHCPNDPDDEGYSKSDECWDRKLGFDQDTCSCGCPLGDEDKNHKDDCLADPHGHWNSNHYIEPPCDCYCDEGWVWTKHSFAAHRCECDMEDPNVAAEYAKHDERDGRGWKWSNTECSWRCEPPPPDPETGLPSACTQDNGDQGWVTDSCGCECMPELCPPGYCQRRTGHCCQFECDDSRDECRMGASCKALGPAAKDGDDLRGRLSSNCGNCLCAEDGSRECADGIEDLNSSVSVVRKAVLEPDKDNGNCKCSCAKSEIGRDCTRAYGKAGCTEEAGCPGIVSDACQCICDRYNQPCTTPEIDWGRFDENCECQCDVGSVCVDRDTGAPGTVMVDKTTGRCVCGCDSEEKLAECEKKAEQPSIAIGREFQSWVWDDYGCRCKCVDAGRPCSYYNEFGEVVGGFILADTCDCGDCDKTANDCAAPSELDQKPCSCTCDEADKYMTPPCEEWEKRYPELGCKCDCLEDISDASCRDQTIDSPLRPEDCFLKKGDKCKCTCSCSGDCTITDPVTGEARGGQIDPDTCECTCPYASAEEAGCDPDKEEFDPQHCKCRCIRDEEHMCHAEGVAPWYPREEEGCRCHCAQTPSPDVPPPDCSSDYGGTWVDYDTEGGGCHCDCRAFDLGAYFGDHTDMNPVGYWVARESQDDCKVACAVSENMLTDKLCFKFGSKTVRNDGKNCDCLRCTEANAGCTGSTPDFDAETCECYCEEKTCSGDNKKWSQDECKCVDKCKSPTKWDSRAGKCVTCDEWQSDPPSPCAYWYWDTSDEPNCKWSCDSSKWNAEVAVYKDELARRKGVLEVAIGSVDTESRPDAGCWCEKLNVTRDRLAEMYAEFDSAVSAVTDSEAPIRGCIDELTAAINRSYGCCEPFPTGCSADLSGLNAAATRLSAARQVLRGVASRRYRCPQSDPCP